MTLLFLVLLNSLRDLCIYVSVIYRIYTIILNLTNLFSLSYTLYLLHPQPMALRRALAALLTIILPLPTVLGASAVVARSSICRRWIPIWTHTTTGVYLFVCVCVCVVVCKYWYVQCMVCCSGSTTIRFE